MTEEEAKKYLLSVSHIELWNKYAKVYNRHVKFVKDTAEKYTIIDMGIDEFSLYLRADHLPIIKHDTESEKDK